MENLIDRSKELKYEALLRDDETSFKRKTLADNLSPELSIRWVVRYQDVIYMGDQNE